jgi:hypothetical protein
MHSPRSTSPHSRSGYLYVAVMVVATLVGLVGLSAISVARMELRSAVETQDSSNATRLSQSGIELALAKLKTDPAWRTSLASGTEYPPGGVSLNGGTLSWKVIDSDGSLSDDNSDFVKIYGIGRCGGMTTVTSVLAWPSGSPLSCLEASFHSQNSLTLSLLVDWTTDQIISSNGDVSASAFGADINGKAEAAGTVRGNVNGSATSNVAPRRMPGDSAFDYYLARGTWVDVSSLPIDGAGNPMVSGVVLGPGSNPFGSSTNSAGIYIIDCKGKNLQFTNCRIAGTIVILNPGSNVRIKDAVNWKNAVENLPAVLVSGNIGIAHDTGVLDERDVGANFNPVGSPWEGETDTSMNDTYPSEIEGLIYVSGTLSFPAFTPESNIDGVVVCESVAAYSPADFTYQSTFKSYPPPGFAFGSDMQIVPGSWLKDVLP